MSMHKPSVCIKRKHSNKFIPAQKTFKFSDVVQLKYDYAG